MKHEFYAYSSETCPPIPAETCHFSLSMTLLISDQGGSSFQPERVFFVGIILDRFHCFSHGIHTLYFDAMCIVNDAVTNSISDCRIVD
jgi:hypothetical protein